VQINDNQSRNGLKIGHIAGNEWHAMNQRRRGNNGIGQLNALLLPQQNSLLNYRLIEGKYSNAAYQRLHKRILSCRLRFGKQFNARYHRQAYCTLPKMLV
jgi:hypothetical protein